MLRQHTDERDVEGSSIKVVCSIEAFLHMCRGTLKIAFFSHRQVKKKGNKYEEMDFLKCLSALG